MIPDEPHWLEPELARRLLALGVNMDGFVAVETVEEEPEWARYALDGRHGRAHSSALTACATERRSARGTVWLQSSRRPIFSVAGGTLKENGTVSQRPTIGRQRAQMTFDIVCDLARSLPEVEESTSYGTPALKVRGKLFARLKEDGETLVLRTDAFERAHLMRSAPDVFFITDHYREHPWVLVRLPVVSPEQMRELLEGAWRRVAPKKLVTDFDAARA